VQAVFRKFDRDCDRILSESEMGAFARATGFMGSAGEWAEEFRELCPAGTSGIDLDLFCSLVEDRSDQGCFCSDKELQGMLTSRGSEVPAPGVQTSAFHEEEREHVASASLGQSTAVVSAAASPMEAQASRRAQLVRMAFARFDADGDGILNEREMHVFAAMTGFDGTEADWAEEYQLLCAGSGSLIDLPLF
jgi:Ca2+-binding EF-hand superfamily protein